ncbi:MAG: hypothetical protein CL678_00335 [Bdellovibrionaceae bacterium]|nr:hypothetical protein [Pseudobdellovibrionaceae bacterium]
MIFVDLCIAGGFEISYALERWIVEHEDVTSSVSVHCRALCRVFRSARRWQPHTLHEIRAAMQRPLLQYVGRPHPTQVTRVTYGGVNCIQVAGENPIFVVHGGGFVAGNWAGYGGYCNALARISERGVVFIDYNTSQPHSEQVKQIAAVLEEARPSTVVADSAGGHLTLCAYEDYGVAATQKTILFSPVADPRCISDSFVENGNCYLENRCFGNDPVGEVMLNPTVTATLLQSITDRVACIVPPNTLVFASENELFADDARLLERSGAEVCLDPAKPGGTFHAWPLWDIPEAEKTLQAALNPSS